MPQCQLKLHRVHQDKKPATRHHQWTEKPTRQDSYAVPVASSAQPCVSRGTAYESGWQEHFPEQIMNKHR